MNPLARNVKWGAYLCFAQAALYAFSVCVLTIFLGTMFRSAAQGSGATSSKFALTSAALIPVVFCIGLIVIVPFGVTGIGLLRRWGWAKWVAILLSGLGAVLAFPLGTLLGVPTIILLLLPDPKPAFPEAFPTDTSATF